MRKNMNLLTKTLDVDKLRGELVRQKISNNYLAEQWGITAVNTSLKLNGKVKITPNELYIVAMITKKPIEYFYSDIEGE
jgi:hypothetical protein